VAKSCCEKKAGELEQLRLKQGGVLKAVLWINAAMFVIELTTGILSRSTALMADSLDMFGDASVYAFSLYALHRGAIWRARAGYAKGVIMALFGMLVLLQVLYRFALQSVPVAEAMSAVGMLALAANGVCLYLLFNHRADDINMRSTWLCSRNDIVANLGVITASVLVAIYKSGVPDLVVGVLIAGLFLWSAASVISEAKLELSEV
jgi:Co/Zn/Cd efflux system component